MTQSQSFYYNWNLVIGYYLVIGAWNLVITPKRLFRSGPSNGL